MAYYPPPGTHQSIVYPGTPGMVGSTIHYPGTPIAPGTLAPQHLSPNVVYVPSRSNSRNSHRHDDYDRSHHRSHSDSHGHSRSSGSRRHRRHESDGHHHHRRSRSHRHRDREPQVLMVPPQAGIVPTHHNAYGYYRPTWSERLRQFFGFAPTSHQYKYKSNTHSWGFFGRSRRPQYVDPYSGTEVDRYGRPVVRM